MFAVRLFVIRLLLSDCLLSDCLPSDANLHSQFFHCLRPSVLCVFPSRNSGLRTQPSNATYVPAVSHLHIQYGHGEPFAAALPQLTYVLRGVRRTQGRAARDPKPSGLSSILATIRLCSGQPAARVSSVF